MSRSLRVNLHCHSDLSDGQLRPEVLAELLANSGVRVAALTDHDTVEGLPRFAEVLARRGVAHLPGLELSTILEGTSIHLLAYGFDPHSPHLAEALGRVRDQPGLPTPEGIRLIHRAGGKAYLAHPLELEADLTRLKARLEALQAWGLDGLEAVYAPYSAEQIHALLDLAQDLGMTVCAGSDFHGPAQPGLSALGVNVPLAHWRAFRDHLFATKAPVAPATPPPQPPTRRLPRLDGWNFLWRILAPTFVAILLLLVPLFAYVVPAFESALLSRKREMIQELTASACSILEEYRQEVVAGRLSLAEAQAAAVARLQFLRYGREGKDYFWITDLQPRMIMHPYRTDLNGTDLSRFQDPQGVRVFVAAAELVKARTDGYLEYVWQWKDDARRMQAKQSYVRLFEPWGWVVGTGLYLEDVHAEISRLTGRIIRVSLVVALVVSLLLLFLARQSFRMERQRILAEEALAESHERYRALVHASKEGMILLLRGRPVFANPVFLEMARVREAEWDLLDLDELLVTPGGLHAWMDAALEAPGGPQPVAAQLLTRAGGCLEVLLAVESIQIGAELGTLLVVRDLSALQPTEPTPNLPPRSIPLNLALGGGAPPAEARPTPGSDPLGQLAHRLRGATQLQELNALKASLPELVDAMLQQGQRARQLCRGLSAVADAAVASLLTQGIAHLGEPPAPFAYLALGSHGREELTLHSDQDSALVYGAISGADPDATQAYFLALAERVSTGLEALGYPPCEGGMMARNPHWCRPLPGWQQHCSGWIRRTEPQDLLDFGAFYDFRCLQGDPALVESLRGHIRQKLAETPAFLSHLARLALDYRSQPGFLGQLLAPEGGTVDLKETLAPIVHIARLYALRQGCPGTGTAARLRHLHGLGHLSAPGLADLLQGQEFLLALRLRHQAEQLGTRRNMDNLVDLKRLSHLEEALLKQVSALVPLLQKKVGFDFLGTA